MAAAPFAVIGGKLRVFLRVTPKAAKNGVGGIRIDGAGVARQLVSVTAVPEGGKANAAVIKVLAKAWRLPKSAFRLIAGSSDRNKTMEIDTGDDPVTLMTYLKEGGRGHE